MVEMVRFEVAAPLPGVMLAGANAQVSVLGNPLHESVIEVFEVPDCMAAVTVTCFACPNGIVTDPGAAVKEITGGGGGGGGRVCGHVGE